MNPFFYNKEAGDEGAAASFPCTSNPRRSSSASLRNHSRNSQLDEADTYRHDQHASVASLRCLFGFNGTPFGFPLELPFTCTGIPRIGSPPPLQSTRCKKRRAQSLRKNSIMLGSSRHFFFLLRAPPPGSQAARAFALMARSVSAYILVVSSETCPSHALIVLRSTPARSRWVAVVWRIVCGLIRLIFNDGMFCDAASAWRATSAWTPNRVIGSP